MAHVGHETRLRLHVGFRQFLGTAEFALHFDLVGDVVGNGHEKFDIAIAARHRGKTQTAPERFAVAVIVEEQGFESRAAAEGVLHLRDGVLGGFRPVQQGKTTAHDLIRRVAGHALESRIAIDDRAAVAFRIDNGNGAVDGRQSALAQADGFGVAAAKSACAGGIEQAAETDQEGFQLRNYRAQQRVIAAPQGNNSDGFAAMAAGQCDGNVARLSFTRLHGMLQLGHQARIGVARNHAQYGL